MKRITTQVGSFLALLGMSAASFSLTLHLHQQFGLDQAERHPIQQPVTLPNPPSPGESAPLADDLHPSRIPLAELQSGHE